MRSSELCESYQSKYGRPISVNNMKQTLLNELISNGYIDEDDSELDKRAKIYFPLVELDEEKSSNCNNAERMDNFLQFSNIVPPKNFNRILNNWLKFEILNLLIYPLNIDKFKLLDKNGNETCICQFVKEYEKRRRLNGFFVMPENDNSSKEIFGNIELISKT